MRRSIISSIIAIMIFTAAGCASKKRVAGLPEGKPVDVASRSKTEKLEAIKAADFVYSTLAMKAKADVAINDNVNDVTLNFRIQKDRAIWVSVTAVAGLEVARALITPDSIKVLNRLENVYLKKPFRYIHRFTNDQINFSMVQSILVGNSIPELVSESSSLQTTPQVEFSGMLESIRYAMTFSNRNKLLRTQLSDPEDQTIRITYSDFVSANGKDFPESVSIKSRAGNKSIAAQLKYTKIDVNSAIEIPFSVPKRFTVID